MLYMSLHPPYLVSDHSPLRPTDRARNLYWYNLSPFHNCVLTVTILFPPQMAAAQPLETVVGLYGDSHINYVGQADFGPNIRLQTFEHARGRDFS